MAVATNWLNPEAMADRGPVTSLGPPADDDTTGVTPSLAYIPALDGVRGLAVAAVLLYHGGHLRGGFLSVDLFFALSGFLITSLLLVEVGRTRRVDLSHFWLRRAKRLLPALFAMIIGVAFFAWLFASPSELDRIRGDAISTLLYYANWHAIFAGHGYWDLVSSPSPLEHAWSLAIEEQFYLVWPLVVGGMVAFVGWRARRGRSPAHVAPTLLTLCVVGAFASPLMMALLFDPGVDPSRIYVRTDTRMGTILMGAGLACLMTWRGPIRSRAGRTALEIFAIISLAGMLAAWTWIDGQREFVYRGGFLLFDVACIALIAAGAHPRRSLVARFLSWRPIVALGLISYGLYLWHWPVYVTLTSSRTGLDGYALLTVRIAVSLVFGTASYFLIEKPIRRSHVSGRQILRVAPIAAAVCVAAVVVSTSGGTSLPQAGAQFIASPNSRTASDLRQAVDLAATSGARRLLILGDSVGVNLGRTAAMMSVGSDVTVVAGAVPGCVLTDGVGGYRATSHERTFVVSQLNECTTGWYSTLHQFRPDTVVLVYGTGASFLDVQVDGRWVNACDPLYRRWYAARLRALTAEFAANGASKIALLRLPYPTADFLPETSRASIDCVNAVHAAVADESPAIELLDLASLVCPAGRCRTYLDGARVRSDGLHFDEGAPAEYVARWLLEQTRT